MQNLQCILNRLESGSDPSDAPYFIPKAWNTVGYSQFSEDANHESQININPRRFMAMCIREGILPYLQSGRNYLDPLPSTEINLSQSVIYAVFLRAFTAWDHAGNGTISSGTFLKAICLLPYLKALNVNIIYLLPFFKHSDKYKKGELGCPYSIKNIYQLDPHLHDEILGPFHESVIEVECKAFIEACHILGMKVMVDFAFRTVSRDNDLIAEHPDWFYWIHLRNSHAFTPPTVESEPRLTLVNDCSLKSLYTCKQIAGYLAQFTCSPSEIDPLKWHWVLEKYHSGQGNILDLIETAFQITTAPGFSDVLNDPQPPWTDVTYLKFYLDSNPKAKPYLPADQPPYILQDIASSNLYPGEIPNRELWEYILQTIPYYQEKFGIDGARIDMGHALPPELARALVTRVKDRKQQFILWSEEFNPENSLKAKEDGYHFISGNLWEVYNAVDESLFHKKLISTVSRSALPLTAALETPDTPRMAWIYRDRRRITLMIVLNFLTPNAVPLITGGMELLEIQPMNLGLNNNEFGRFVLDSNDPMYGKLAFFDNYCFHWLTRENQWICKLLKDIITIRNHFAGLIWDPDNLIDDYDYIRNPKILFLCYYNQKIGQNLFVMANKDLQAPAGIVWKTVIPKQVEKAYRTVHYQVMGDDSRRFTEGVDQERNLKPGEVLVGYLE